jgi:uncharacterized membrane protein YphA (DoxX/SURF4 family)
MSQSVKVALIVGAAILLVAWYYVHNEPEHVCARGLSSETGESYDDALVRCAMNLR